VRVATPMTPLRPGLVLFVLLSVVVATPFSMQAAAPAASTPVAFDLPAADATVSLKRFAEQSGREIVYPPEAVKGVTTNPVRGSFAPRAALDALVAGTPLAVVESRSGALAVNRSPDPNAPGAAPRASSDRPGPNQNSAATATTADNASGTNADGAITLSPFEVTSDKDQGYAASSSLAGSRLATELKFIPAPVSVLTREFLDDLAVTDLQEAMAWSVNTNTATGSDASSGAFQNGLSTLANSNNDIRTRGGIQLNITRNFFRWSVNSDTYNTERLDVSRGPNALLFGDSSLAGMVNVTTKRANFRDATSAQVQTSSYGGMRASLDTNRTLRARTLAVRLNAFTQQTQDWRDYGSVNRRGASLAATWRALRDVEVRVEGEWGRRSDVQAATYLRSAISGWNHQTVFDAPGALTAAQATAAGLRRTAVGTFVLNNARPQDGPVDWGNQADTAIATAPGEIESRIGTRLYPASPYAPVLLTQRAVLSATPIRKDLTAPSFAFSMRNAAGGIDAEHHAATVAVEKRFAQNLTVEIASNLQLEDRIFYNRQADTVRVAYDVNRLLPAGQLINGSNANPYFLAPYIQSQPRVFNNYTRVYEGRATAVYQFSRPWTKQSLGVLASARRSDSGQARRALVRTNSPIADLSSTANYVNFRSYVEDRGTSFLDFKDGPTYTLGNTTMAYVNNRGTVGGQTHADTTIKSYQVFASGSWLESERLHTVVGVRRDVFRSKQYGTHIFDAVTGRYVRSDLTEILSTTIDSPSAGAVLTIFPWLSFYGNASRAYNPPTTAVLDYQNRAIAAPEGETRELGIKFSFLAGRISGSAGRYDSQQKNNILFSNALNTGLQNINLALGLPPPGTPSDSSTLQATGTEYEVVTNLTPAWTLTANLAFPHTDTSGAYPSFRAIFNANESAWRAIAANTADPRSAVLRTELNRIDNVLLPAAAGEGVEDVRNRKLTANLVTRYRFATGRLKGLTLGGGANYLGDQKIARNLAAAEDIYNEGFWLFSAFARYQFKLLNRTCSVQANATNLLDTEKFRYVSLNNTLTNSDSYRVSNPREIRVTFNAAF
jgi:outer membrane receptor protein involved in Fe transport